MRNTNSRMSAFTLVEIMIVVAIIGLLAAIAIPNFVRVRERAQMNACINNLRLIDAAKQQWALEFKHLGSETPVLTDIGPYMVRAATGARLPVCPAASGDTNFSSSYTINQVVAPPTCKMVPASHVLPF